MSSVETNTARIQEPCIRGLLDEMSALKQQVRVRSAHLKFVADFTETIREIEESEKNLVFLDTNDASVLCDALERRPDPQLRYRSHEMTSAEQLSLALSAHWCNLVGSNTNTAKLQDPSIRPILDELLAFRTRLDALRLEIGTEKNIALVKSDLTRMAELNKKVDKDDQRLLEECIRLFWILLSNAAHKRRENFPAEQEEDEPHKSPPEDWSDGHSRHVWIV